MNLNFWNQKKVFVTGATGLLGPWLIKTLTDCDAHVVALIRDNVPQSNFYSLGLDKKVVSVNGSLNDYPLIERTLNEYEIDSCFHLGAQTIVGTSNRSPMSTFESNIMGTCNVLEASRNSKLLERLIVASSDKAYGSQKILPYNEDMPLNGEHPYDVSKSCCDLISKSYFKTYGLPVGITRCGNFFGGGDLNFNRIIPQTMRSIIFGENPVIRSDGSPIREYFYILDAVDAYMTLAENLHKKEVCGQSFNFGNEQPISVLELVSKMLALFDKNNLKPEVLGEGKNEIEKQYLSCEKASKVLGWKHKYSFDESLKNTFDWYVTYFSKGV